MEKNLNNHLDDIIHDYDFAEIYKKCKPFTMTSVERAYALYNSCKYIVKNSIEGDFVECGVWKGGSAMLIVHTLLSLGISDRKIYMYDTFEGMSEPEEVDVDKDNRSAKLLLEEDDSKESHVWAIAPEKEVRRNLFSTGYKKENIIFIKGKVEETIPKIIPEKIALLRLDTDWYSSTYHELKYLYPCLIGSGVLIIDDYGHWVGAKKAVDKYFAEFNRLVLFNRIDYTGRLLIKQQ